jgi:hypothetical protein
VDLISEGGLVENTFPERVYALVVKQGYTAGKMPKRIIGYRQFAFPAIAPEVFPEATAHGENAFLSGYLFHQLHLMRNESEF